jgi:predicted nucleic acid-binding protein
VRRLVLDTSAYSQMRAGHEGVLDRLAAAEMVLVPVTVIGELAAAFELGRRSREDRAVLEEFLAEPFVTTLGVTAEVARTYGRHFARLRRAGTPIPVNDVWIAAETLDCGGHLLTFDRHFERIEGLDCTVLEG